MISKPIGVLFDNVSGNTGDLATGLSTIKILKSLGHKNINILTAGQFDAKDYQTIIIGGGLLIRKKGDFFYDKFRIQGPQILNSIGIHGSPNDLSYLNNYSYISVRSKNDANKLSYLARDTFVCPDTSLLLTDIPIEININKPSIGIHCFYQDNLFDLINFIKKYSDDYYIYLLPITHYNYDYEFMDIIKSYFPDNPKVITLPILKPLEVFSIINKFNYFISYSLHGALFAYRHNIPFLLYNNIADPKMSSFMNERNLNEFTFTKSTDIENKTDNLIKNKPDYSALISQDNKLLKQHINNIKQAIIGSSNPVILIKKLNKNKLYSRFNTIQKQNNKVKKMILRIIQSPYYKINNYLHKIYDK